MRVLRGISRNTRELLSKRERQSHDFKETIQSLKVEDIAAFANASGGTILIGVSTRNDVIAISGCEYGDGAELAVRQKAAEGDPPLRIELSAENTSVPGKAMLRVDIPESPSKPHCSPSGVYKIRDGNKNRNLRPQEMLTMFLDAHATTFVQRFGEATKELTEQLGDVEITVGRMAAEVLRVADDVETRLSETMARLDDAVSNSDDAMTRADEAAGESQNTNELLRELQGEFEDALILLVQLARAGGHDMPDIYRAKRAVRDTAYLVASIVHDKTDKELMAELHERFLKDRIGKTLSAAQIEEIAVQQFAAARKAKSNSKPAVPFRRDTKRTR